MVAAPGAVARVVLLNLAGAALLAAGWAYGLVGAVLAADDVHISKINFALFLLGVGLTVWHMRAIARQAAGSPQTMGSDPAVRAASATAMRMELTHRLLPIRHIASMLVIIGLIGTIVGFIIALSGVSPEAAQDADKIGPMIATLMHGIAMSLFKTLVGAVLNVWLMVNYRMVESAASSLLRRAILMGEARHA